MHCCTASVIRYKVNMYMNRAYAPFMYVYNRFMYRRDTCFQGTPSKYVSANTNHHVPGSVSSTKV